MSNSIAATVSTALGLQNWAMMQEKDNSLLRQVLQNQSDAITTLIDSAPTAPKLADRGTVGTLLHTTA